MDRKLRTYDLTFVLVCGMLAMLHISAWSAYPPDVDPINFTFALSNSFSPANDSPHPPGYPLYVFAARLAASLVGKHHAYQLINLGMLLGSGGALYWLFRRTNAAAIGFASAVLLMTHPLAWAATVVPECYVSDVFFATAILAFVLARRDSLATLLAGVSILFFLLGLVRPVSGIMLIPLAMMAGYTTTRSRSLPLQLAVVATAAVVLAYAMTAYVSGGLEVYRSASLRVMGSAFRESSIFGGAPLSAHLQMISHLIAWFLLLALPTGLCMLAVALKKDGKRFFERNGSALMIGGAWILPPLAFYGAIYYLKPAYQLIYLPCLLIPIAWALYDRESVLARPTANVILAGLVVVQLGIFFLPIPHTPRPIQRQTEAYVIQQDRAWEQLSGKLASLPEKNTLLIWAGHPTLPVYAVRLLDRGSPVAVATPDRTNLNYVDPKTMNWLPGNGGAMVDKRYDGVALVDDFAGQPVVTYVPLTDRQHREVGYLLKPLHQSALTPITLTIQED